VLRPSAAPYTIGHQARTVRLLACLLAASDDAAARLLAAASDDAAARGATAAAAARYDSPAQECYLGPRRYSV
jgi:hypothetical protein